MTRLFEFRHGEPDDGVRRVLDEAANRLERLLEEFPGDAVVLRVILDTESEGKWWRVSATLTVPGRALAAHQVRRRAEEAVRDVFSELQRQLAKYKAKARHSDEYKRRARREQLRHQKAEPVLAAERPAEVLSALLPDHLPDLYNFVRREIAYHVAMGDLGPDDVTADDIVAAVAERAQLEFANKAENRDVRSWLIQLALDELDREVARQARRPAASLEQDIPETPPTEAVSTLGDETLDFHQPDEDLRLEDVLPAQVPTPEEILESRELQEYTARTLARLPRAWRRAFVLRYIEDLPVAEVARIVGASAEDVERRLAQARDWLRQRLALAGLAPQDHEVETMFGMAADVDVPEPARRAVDDVLARSAGASAHRAEASSKS